MLYLIKMIMTEFNKILMFVSLLTVTLLIFYGIVGRNIQSIHSTKEGQDSWTRSMGSFVIVLAVIISEYQLVFSTVDVMLLSLLIGIGITGKVVNSKINE